MTERRLDVWCFGARAGALADAANGLAFTYDEEWLRSGAPPLSQSLPLNGSFTSSAVQAFFGGLLPEGLPRELLGRQLGVSTGNDFGLLEALGGDTAGAVSLLAPGAEPGQPGHDVEWLSDDELEKLIRELPTRPMHADEDGEFRLSLAGVQDKLPVVLNSAGRIGLTKGRTPSTHILKTPIPGLNDTVANEALCPALLAEAGLGPAAARRRLRALSNDAPNAVRDARAELAALGWDSAILDRVVDTVDRRARLLLEIAAPSRAVTR